MRRWLVFVGCLLLGLGALASGARAQQGGDPLRLGAGMVVDFAGGITYDPPGTGNSVHDSPRATPGLRVHLDYDVHRYLSVGGLVRMTFFRADDLDSGRNMLVDIAGRVNGHYDFKDFRFYATLMLGPAFSRMHDPGSIDNPGVGLAVSFAPGLEWWFSRKVGLFTEIFGWSGHFMRHDYAGVPGHLQVRLNQVLWQLGAVFAL